MAQPVAGLTCARRTSAARVLSRCTASSSGVSPAPFTCGGERGEGEGGDTREVGTCEGIGGQPTPRLRARGGGGRPG